MAAPCLPCTDRLEPEWQWCESRMPSGSVLGLWDEPLPCCQGEMSAVGCICWSQDFGKVEATCIEQDQGEGKEQIFTYDVGDRVKDGWLGQTTSAAFQLNSLHWKWWRRPACSGPAGWGSSAKVPAGGGKMITASRWCIAGTRDVKQGLRALAGISLASDQLDQLHAPFFRSLSPSTLNCPTWGPAWGSQSVTGALWDQRLRSA